MWHEIYRFYRSVGILSQQIEKISYLLHGLIGMSIFFFLPFLHPFIVYPTYIYFAFFTFKFSFDFLSLLPTCFLVSVCLFIPLPFIHLFTHLFIYLSDHLLLGAVHNIIGIDCKNYLTPKELPSYFILRKYLLMVLKMVLSKKLIPISTSNH